MSSLREKTYEIICSIIVDNKYSNLSLRNNFDNYDERDQSLISEIVYGTLQNYYFLNYQWQRFVKEIPSVEIGCLLNMSIYQLIYLDKVPSYAIVNDAVEIAKSIEYGKYVKLTNAILHKFIREGKLEADISDQSEALSISTSHPLWLIKMWQAHYGLEVTKQICFYDLTHQPQALRVNTQKISVEELLKQPGFSAGKLVDSAVYYSGNILKTTFFKEGYVVAQDEASQAVSIFSGVKDGEVILDLCSAPGTKATQMAALMHNKGKIIAIDIHQKRVELIKQLCAKLAIEIIEPIVMDALEVSKNYEIGSFDRVLVDVPCSGLGVLRHKPEIKLKTTPKDLDDIVVLQKNILTQAAKMVRLNGYLIYSTCTLNKKENEKQIETFLTAHPEYSMANQRTILPMEYGSDGFYMAKLQRIA